MAPFRRDSIRPRETRSSVNGLARARASRSWRSSARPAGSSPEHFALRSIGAVANRGLYGSSRGETQALDLALEFGGGLALERFGFACLGGREVAAQVAQAVSTVVAP